MSAMEAALRPIDDYANDYTFAFEIDPTKAALVVVDMQYATASRTAGLGKLLTEAGTLEQKAGERFHRIETVVVPNLQRMLAFFRRHRLRVIFTTVGCEMQDFSDAPLHKVRIYRAVNNRRGQLEHEILKELQPAAGEVVMNKISTSAFTSTGIDFLLRTMGIEYLLFSGVSTNMCVGTTARDAADRGYHCILIEDCCGAAKDEYHRWEIVTFQRLFGRVDTSERVMAEIERKLASERSPGKRS